MLRELKTQKGTPIRRYRPWTVGKEMGGFVYLHVDYVALLPEEQQKKYWNAFNAAYQYSRPLRYNVIKISIKEDIVTFFDSPEFDTEPEPVVGSYICVKNSKCKVGWSQQIWHHKWLFVRDNYPAFNVDASFDRSREWLKIPDIDFSRIGNRDFWFKTLKNIPL